MMGQETMPYKFKRGQKTQAEVDFVPGVYCNELRMKIRVKLTTNWFDYPVEEKNMCNDLIKGSCPLKPGDKATFRMEMPVHKKYPKLNLRVEIKLVNESDVPVCGFQISGKTVD
ncbi:hypothetical protein J437_LFUL004259 [Ladona fulva]|uniref:MD-2-related lipid-recognition domain-containing protein n=1 Tax=Ladona fulva TaxID=123851 RepID=A0A8K0KIQ5_LADFU|nr:hypothetical protein J437_LFUL004259 [Ladona fulva]